MVINSNYFNNIGRISVNHPTASRKNTTGELEGFGRILQQEVNKNSELKFSKHAELRLQSRNIILSQSQKEKIKEAVRRAEAKGIRDSLIIVDNVAFVVNIKKQTVITAVDSNELKENVFTNIDGAVFA